jgi:hypothetical protein
VGDGTCDATQDLKGVAWQKCLDMGATLTDVKVRNTCADGTIGAIIATCCAGADPVPTPVDPRPTCVYGAEGGETSCKTYDVWKAYGNDYCSALNLVLVDVSTGDPCGDDGFRYAKYACCP